MKSMSSRSMLLITMILSLLKKWSESSFTASRRIDFCTSSTLHPVFLIFLHIYIATPSNTLHSECSFVPRAASGPSVCSR